MKNLLRLDSSIFSSNGVSSQLSDELIQSLMHKYPELEVTHRDFSEDPVPHQDAQRIQAIMTPIDERSSEQQTLADYSDMLIKELQNADTIVIGLPMYNFSVSSVLKAWFDHVARAGTTFRYTNNGPEGLLTGRKVFLITTRGGIHKDAVSDTQLPFVKTFLNFIGLSDIEVIYAEGLNMGGDLRETAIKSAKAHIRSIAA